MGQSMLLDRSEQILGSSHELVKAPDARVELRRAGLGPGQDGRESPRSRPDEMGMSPPPCRAFLVYEVAFVERIQHLHQARRAAEQAADHVERLAARRGLLAGLEREALPGGTWRSGSTLRPGAYCAVMAFNAAKSPLESTRGRQ